MGTHNLNTGVPRGTVNTTTVWDRIIALETKTGNVPNNVQEQLTNIAMAVDGKASQSALEETNANVAANSTKLLDTVTLKPYGSNDTDNWNNAVNSLSSGGQLNLTHGDYYIDGGTLKSNIVIHGRGFPRILSDTYMFIVNSGSPDVANNISNITFEYVVFEAITKTFSQYIHQLILSGVSNITFKNCIFKGFRGDGVYLGSGDAGQERHNENIHFEKCIFDGVNFQNRNAISIVDGDGVSIYKCIFKNCTQPNMPGAVDLEPNSNNWHILKNVKVSKCKFTNIGGNTGAIGMHLPLGQSSLLTPVDNIEFSGNVIKGTNDTQSGIYARQLNGADITKTTAALNLKIRNNTVLNTANFSVFVTGIRGVDLEGNTFTNNKSGINIGSATTGSKVIDIRINGNKLNKPSAGGLAGGIVLFGVEDVDITENIISDALSSSIIFSTGTSKYVKVMQNTFLTPTSNTTIAMEKKSDHTFTTATNIDRDNVFDGVTANFFVALNKDTYLTYPDVGSYDTTKLPDSFAHGEEISAVNGDTNLPSAAKQGILKTIRPTLTSGFRKFTVQWFYPANNDATTLADMYFRKANGATNDWSAWKKITGV